MYYTEKKWQRYRRDPIGNRTNTPAVELTHSSHWHGGSRYDTY